MVNYMNRVAGEKGVTPAEIKAGLTGTVALRTFSTTDDVANLALFLASDEARTITGQSINVDGGQVMS
jgi:NAD(P)-dependent dehydrogenase (short-subunit alcohol dehydrogenase family)